MKKRMILNAFLAVLLLTMASCDSKKKEEAKASPMSIEPTPPSTDTSYEIRYGAQGDRFEIAQTAPGQWIVSGGSVLLTAIVDEKQNYKLLRGDTVAAQGALKTGKLTLRAPDGAFFAEMKLSSDKIKIALTEDDPTPWELKLYEDRAKVRRNEKEFGDAKYYLETEKIKVKDAADGTVAEARRVPGFSVAPAVCLIADADRDMQFLLMATLFAMGK